MTAAKRTVLLTGATDGMGRILAGMLAKRADVSLHVQGRSQGKLRALRKELGLSEERTHLADYANLSSVRKMAKGLAVFETLDVLINNAGMGAGRSDDTRSETEDGNELRFQVNYLAPVLVTEAALTALRRGLSPRIVNVASIGQQAIDFDDPMLVENYSGLRAYSQSKLALVMYTFDLAARLKGEGITSNAIHPGSLLDTKMVRETFGYALGKPEDGARAQLRLALGEDVEGVTGEYFDVHESVRADAQAYDPNARARLRNLTARRLGLDLPEPLTDDP